MSCRNCSKQVNYVKSSNNSSVSMKSYFGPNYLFHSKNCLLEFAFEHFTGIVSYHIKDKKVSEDRFYSQILEILDNMAIMPVFGKKIIINQRFIDKLSIYIMRHFLEPDIIKGDGDNMLPCYNKHDYTSNYYRIVCEPVNEHTISMMESLRKDIFLTLERKWDEM